MRFIHQNGYYTLTEGEEFIFNYLNQTLPLDYEIYIQPNLQGNRPDMILFHKEQGIFVVEVKDWKLEKYYKKDGAFFKYHNQGYIQVANPALQIERYRFVCENLFENIPVICIGYFHNAPSSEVQSLLQSAKINFFGFDNFQDIKTFILKTSHNQIKEIEKIKEVLNPPLHKKEYGEDIKLTPQQKELITHTPKSWKRVRGVAGAGKTIVITQKAGSIASCKKRVLVVCYNKTLKSYIKENIDKTRQDFDWNLIECHHFHEFLKIFAEENGINIKNNKGFDTYEKELLRQALMLIQSGINAKSRRYDAILIDEAQDFKKEWFDFLLNFLSENDEVLLVADDKQNIYDREISWINESMAGYGYKFKGVWGILKDNIRQRKFPEVIEASNHFYELFLREYLQTHPHKNFGVSIKCENIQKPNFVKRLFSSVDLFWENTQEIYESFLNAYKFLLSRGYRDKDIVVLVSTRQSGRNLKDFLDKQNIASQTYFDNKSKEDFMQGGEKIKVITIHSFKGLENGVVVFISEGKEDILGDFETYVAITRATECLIVLNKKEKYQEYSKGWKKYL